jgi:hypothetical protein
MAYLSKYFTLEELTSSQTAARHGLSNEPTEEVAQALKELATAILDQVQELIGPVIITSGYRSPAVNSWIGGAATSQHIKGEAADINVRGITPAQLTAALWESGLPVDQVILEFERWVHVSYRASGGRRQFLVATKDGRRTVYSPYTPPPPAA